ncbi:MAG: ABC transporter ATP-binding protein [Caldisericaceae bacterium]|nr:ABC transporter ATP-binding protein [Caldisericaceae bacterium]
MKSKFAIEVRGVKKSFGNTVALNGISLTVNKGSITGLVGRNGAGKTTLLRILLQLLKPDSGEAFVLGEKMEGDKFEVRRKIGYVPEFFSLYSDMNGWELLKLNASLKNTHIDKEKVEKLSELFSIDLNKRAGVLSKGAKQALAFVVAVSTSPELLILDEPMSGMDPIARDTFIKAIVDECAQGTTVFYSSHILPEVESFADTVCIINQGKCVLEEALDTLKSRFKRISFLPSRTFSENVLKTMVGIKRFEYSGNGVVVYTSAFSGNLLAELSKFSEGEPEVENLTLSEIFKEVIE